MDEETSREIQTSISQCLPKNANVLFLSLTGSRAFGWAADSQDYDVHGVFLCNNYWDWVHSGKQSFDINLYEFTHVASDIHNQHFEQFMNWSNPFYVDSKFDLDGLLQFCTPEAVKQKQGDIQAQINRFKFDQSPRTALHAYRILMIPIYFLENSKFELNVFKINEKYSFEQLSKLKDAYNIPGKPFDITKVNDDLDYLLKLYNQMLTVKTIGPDPSTASEWMKNVRAKYAGEN